MEAEDFKQLDISFMLRTKSIVVFGNHRYYRLLRDKTIDEQKEQPANL